MVPDYRPYQGRDWPDSEKGFAKMIDLMDETVGEISARLDDLGITEKTLVIFTSDNGPHQEGGHSAEFFNSNGPLRGHKRDLYEGGIRVPMIARWPGTIADGSQSDLVFAFWDVLPTFCDIAGVRVPRSADGLSFLPTLLNREEDQQKHDYLYWEFYEQGGKQAVREGNWKFIRLNTRADKEHNEGVA